MTFTNGPQQPAIARRKTRVLCDANLPPTLSPNPRWVDDGKGTEPDAGGHPRFIRNCDAHDFMVSMGVEEACMISAGTINMSPMWRGKTGDEVAWGRNFDWSLSKELCDPIDAAAMVELGRLVRRPETYKATAKPYCPIIVDVENKPTMNVAANAPLPQRISCVQYWLNAVRALKQGAGETAEVWLYAHFPCLTNLNPERDATLEALLTQLNEEVSAACAYLYFWDLDAENPNRWLEELEQLDANIIQHAPWYTAAKVLVVNPCFAIYSPQNDHPQAADLNNTPIPMPRWMPFIDEVADRGWMIYLWPGDHLVDDIKPQIQYAASRGFNYTPGK